MLGDLVTSYEPTLASEQQDQQFHGFAFEPDGAALAEKLEPATVETEVAELIHGSGHKAPLRVQYSIEFLRKYGEFNALALHQIFTSSFTRAPLRIAAWMGLAQAAGDPGRRRDEFESETMGARILRPCIHACNDARRSGGVRRSQSASGAF